MQRAGAAEGAADFVAANGFADMGHYHQSGPGSVAQAQQRLAESRQGAGIVFGPIVSGGERVGEATTGAGGGGWGCPAAGRATAPPVRRTSWRRCRSQQRLRGGIQQDRFPDGGLLARSRQAQGGQNQFVDLAENAFGGLIEGLPRSVVEQRLGHAGGLELMREVGIELFARG